MLLARLDQRPLSWDIGLCGLGFAVCVLLSVVGCWRSNTEFPGCNAVVPCKNSEAIQLEIKIYAVVLAVSASFGRQALRKISAMLFVVTICYCHPGWGLNSHQSRPGSSQWKQTEQVLLWRSIET
jgi:hypothetical protein